MRRNKPSGRPTAKSLQAISPAGGADTDLLMMYRELINSGQCSAGTLEEVRATVSVGLFGRMIKDRKLSYDTKQSTTWKLKGSQMGRRAASRTVSTTGGLYRVLEIGDDSGAPVAAVNLETVDTSVDWNHSSRPFTSAADETWYAGSEDVGS